MDDFEINKRIEYIIDEYTQKLDILDGQAKIDLDRDCQALKTIHEFYLKNHKV